MATTLTYKFKYKNATSVRGLFHDVDDKGNLKHHVYLFIARNRAWTDNNSPDTPNTLTSLSDEMDVYNDIIVLKKLSASDVSIVVPAYEWTTGTGYTTWEHNDSDIFDRDGSPTQPFYVVTQEDSTDWSVWKCLGNLSGVSSTVEPTITSGLSDKHIKSTVINDGFVWKYMYSISNTQYQKFGGSNVTINSKKWMPVKTLFSAPSAVDNNSTTSQWDVQRQAVHGGVHFVKPTSAITSADDGKLVRLDGDGTGFEATISSVVIGATTHYYVRIDDPGQDYTYVRRVMVQGTSGGASVYPTNFVADSNLSVILAPIGGHGWDAVEELGGHRMMIYTTLPGNTQFGEQGAGYQHEYASDYQTVGLLIDPIKSRGLYDNIVNGSTKGEVVMTGDRQLEPDATNVARLTYTTTVKDGSNIVNDTDWIEKEVMQVDGTSVDSTFQAIGRVINIDTTNKYLYVIPYAGTTKHTQFEADLGSYVFLHSSGAPVGGNYFTINAVKPNDILPFSGDIIYLDNRGQITRESGKTETVRIIIEF